MKEEILVQEGYDKISQKEGRKHRRHEETTLAEIYNVLADILEQLKKNGGS